MSESTGQLHIAFATSAFNEEENLGFLCERCFGAAEYLGVKRGLSLRTEIIIADNCSQDQSRIYLKRLVESDRRIRGYLNERNYGVEASFVHALRAALDTDADFIVMLCSDLQDPPEMTSDMLDILMGDSQVDGVLCVKKKSSGSVITRLSRKAYYEALGLSSRMQIVPSGFHGFGCYRRRVILEMLRLWEKTDLNLRQCLTNACQSPRLLGYEQSERERGKSTYNKYRYWKEATRAIVMSDAVTSRVSVFVGLSSLLFVVLAGLFLVVNILTGKSGYEAGTPTLMGLVLISFSVQVLLVGMVSRQIESLRMGGLRPTVYSRKI